MHFVRIYVFGKSVECPLDFPWNFRRTVRWNVRGMSVGQSAGQVCEKTFLTFRWNGAETELCISIHEVLSSDVVVLTGRTEYTFRQP